MRNSIYVLFFASMLTFGCGDSAGNPLITPASYRISSISSISVHAFRTVNGDFVEIPISESGEPDISGVSESLDVLILDNENQLQFNDGLDFYTVDYQVDDDKLEFVGGGSRYSLEISDDGKQLKHLTISGGPFSESSPNGWVSASCQDVNCTSINFDEWLFNGSEGEVQYVIVLEESYLRE